MSEKKISYETRGDMATVISYLTSLVAGLEQKRVILSSADEEILLYPGEDIDFKVKARVKKGEGKIELKLAWQQEQGQGEIVISS